MFLYDLYFLNLFILFVGYCSEFMKMRPMLNMKINTNFGIPLKFPPSFKGNLCFTNGNTGEIPVP